MTDIGMRRSNNQDSHAAIPADSAQHYGSRGHLFIVADGMGAHAAGELASRMAVERITSAYCRSRSGPFEGIESIDFLRIAVEEANEIIHQRGQQNPEFHNMGTTASSLALVQEGAIIGHVGDSRVYRLRGHKLEQMTFDHSLVWEMEASGQVHPDSALGQSIPKNVITRSLGPNPEVQVDSEGPFPVQVGDLFMLCSDGLSGQVEDEEIGAIMACLQPEEAAQVLVDLANLRGGPDNSTVVIVRVDEIPTATDGNARGASHSSDQVVSRLVPAATVACIVGAVILAVAGMYQTMVIAILLGLTAAITGIVQYQLNRKPSDIVPRSGRIGGRAPYRRFSAEPTGQLNDKLKKTVDELRKAASEKCWELDWSEVEKHQVTSQQAASNNEFAEAVRHQAEAIIETMKQLREQHNRAAGETQIDD
ncbi:MAG: PP2C family serine/threonine-protein phosphatase [Planctomycetota bacterium]